MFNIFIQSISSNLEHYPDVWKPEPVGVSCFLTDIVIVIA